MTATRWYAYGPIQGQGEGHGGPKVSKMVYLKVHLSTSMNASKKLTVNVNLWYSETISTFCLGRLLIFILVLCPPGWNLQVIICLELVVRSTLCLILRVDVNECSTIVHVCHMTRSKVKVAEGWHLRKWPISKSISSTNMHVNPKNNGQLWYSKTV